MNISEITSKYDFRGGIYKIQNIANGRCYIGSANQIVTRLKQHYKQLKSNKHINKELQQDYNIFGVANFNIEVVEFFEGSRQDLLKREQLYIDSIVALNINYYNSSLCCNNTRSTPLTKQTKVFISNIIDPKYTADKLSIDTFNTGSGLVSVVCRTDGDIVNYSTIHH